MTPPWLLPGLPEGLTPEHFAAAATVWVSHENVRLGDIGSDELRPLLGLWGTHAHLYGMQYENNAARLDALRDLPPLARTSTGAAVHPVLLLPDPSPSPLGNVPAEQQKVPVAAISVVGYIGSAWSSLGAEVIKEVRRKLVRRVFYVTVVAMTWTPEPEGRLWLPHLGPT